MSKRKDDGLSTALDSIMGIDADLPETTPQSAPQSRTERKKKDYSQLQNKTVTVAFRVPKSEKERLERVIRERYGLRLSQGLKKIVYQWLNNRGQK